MHGLIISEVGPALGFHRFPRGGDGGGARGAFLLRGLHVLRARCGGLNGGEFLLSGNHGATAGHGIRGGLGLIEGLFRVGVFAGQFKNCGVRRDFLFFGFVEFPGVFQFDPQVFREVMIPLRQKSNGGAVFGESEGLGNSLNFLEAFPLFIPHFGKGRLRGRFEAVLPSLTAGEAGWAVVHFLQSGERLLVFFLAGVQRVELIPPGV